MTRSFFYCNSQVPLETGVFQTHALLELYPNISCIRSFGIRVRLLGLLEPNVVIGIWPFFDIEIVEDPRQNYKSQKRNIVLLSVLENALNAGEGRYVHHF